MLTRSNRKKLYTDNAKTAIDATDTCQATEFWRLIFDDRFPKS